MYLHPERPDEALRDVGAIEGPGQWIAAVYLNFERLSTAPARALATGLISDALSCPSFNPGVGTASYPAAVRLSVQVKPRVGQSLKTRSRPARPERLRDSTPRWGGMRREYRGARLWG